jgi:hypothetical protein
MPKKKRLIFIEMEDLKEKEMQLFINILYELLLKNYIPMI